MKKVFFIMTLLTMLVFFLPQKTYADEYVLPYPSAMPGSAEYKIHQVIELISRYWYFGDFGVFEFSLKESDKYLVEAKTLFEYKQFLLGYHALEKSDKYFAQTVPALTNAKKHGKNISEKEQILHAAAQKHIEVLKKMESETPAAFTWDPEKGDSTSLQIHAKIVKSILLRGK